MTAEQRLASTVDMIYHLCYQGDLDEIKRRFSQMGETQIERTLSVQQGQFEFTPIHAAATNGRAEVLEYLLQISCARCRQLINTQTAKTGYTPLHLAVINGHQNCVKVLLRYGADIRATDRDGKTAIQRANARNMGDIVRILRNEGIYVVNTLSCTMLVCNYIICMTGFRVITCTSLPWHCLSSLLMVALNSSYLVMWLLASPKQLQWPMNPLYIQHVKSVW